MNPELDKPLIAITPGDPCGIGPEVVAKALAESAPHEVCRPVVVGSCAALDSGIEVAGVDLGTRKIKNLHEAGLDPARIDVLDEGVLNPDAITPGRVSVECGRANGLWIAQAADLALKGEVAASVMAPVNGEAIAAAGMAGEILGTKLSERFLTLLSGPLRVVHVYDHVPLEDVCRMVDEQAVYLTIVKTCEALAGWGLEQPRIGVAGINPHAHGRQEKEAIEPAVRKAQAEGIRAEGPVAPDTVFRRGIEGRYDVVIAIFHDQGHIAVKTWGFDGNCALFLGAPYLFLSVGHGTAFDIVGKGVANHQMILSAILQAASLSSGRGFL